MVTSSVAFATVVVPVQAQSADGPRPQAAARHPTAVATNGGDQVAELDERLKEIERLHRSELARMQRRMAELERRLEQATINSEKKSAEDPGQPSVEHQAKQGVVRLSYQTFAGKQPAEEDGQQVEQEIDALLREAEERRAEAAPELGAGLGARLAALNPNISVIGDFLGVLSTAPDSFDGQGIPLAGFEEGDVDGFTMREVELLMSAAIDPYADGLLKLAFGEEGVEIEEAYVLVHDYPFRDRLPCCLREVQTKVGVFRMAFGPMNLVDDHDMPTVDRPLAIQRFLGEEGLIRPGVSFSKLLPAAEPWASELTVEFTNGEPPGDEEGAPPFEGIDHPLGLVHYKKFREFEPASDWEFRHEQGCQPRLRDGYRTLELGATFAATGSRAPEGGEDLYSLMQGIDVTWQWYDPRPEVYCQYLLQWELFASVLDQPGDGVRGDVGSYLLGQVRLNRQWFAGLRFDISEFPELDGFQLAATPNLTYFFTEFNRLRLQYQYLRQEIEGEGSEDVQTVWLQWVFAYGAHPPEPYYIRQRY